MEKPPAQPVLTLDRRCWMLGAVDAYNGNPQREAGVSDTLAYASGRIEGQAWKEQGLNLADQLRKNRLPYPVTTPNP